MSSVAAARRSVATAVALAVWLALAPTVLGVNIYAGYQSTSLWQGINGYIRQSATVSTTASHFVWINLCESTCDRWVQTGTFQGNFAGGNSPSAVHMYYENVDSCGQYAALDIGTRENVNQAYYLSYNGTGGYSYYCGDGVYRTTYTFEYRRGSWSNPPFFYGRLRSNQGIAMAKTEAQGSPPLNTDYFGCKVVPDCNDAGGGLHLYNGSTWPTWTSSLSGATASTGAPPYLGPIQTYWAFKTCPSAC